MERTKLKATYLLALGLVLFASASARALNPVRSYLAQNLLDDALRICRQYEVLTTNDKENLFACAWVYYRSNRIDSAEKMMEKARKHFILPEYQLLLAMGKMKRKQFDDAKKMAESIGREFRGSAIGLTGQELSAEVYEAQGQLDTAAFIYKQVVGDDSSRGRAHWGLGRYYLSRGDTGRARTHLEETARIWPKHVGSRYNLGVMAMADNNLGEAARWLGECYKLDKADVGVLEQLGMLFEKKGMINDAIRHWRKALEVKKDSPLAKEKLALYVSSTVDALVDSHQYEEALKQMETQAKTMGTDPQFLLKRGLVYRNLLKWDKAATDLLAYLNSSPNDPSAARELGVCYINLKLPDQARNYFSKAIAMEPANGMNYAWLAYILEGKGDLEGAHESWSKALELLRDPVEVQRATRRLTAVEQRLNKRSQKKKAQEDD